MNKVWWLIANALIAGSVGTIVPESARSETAATSGYAAAGISGPERDEITAHTFSVVAADPETSEVGVAVATRLPAVGMYVPFAEPGVGAVASQAIVNPEYGSAVLRMMREGVSPEDAVTSVTGADPRRDDRQLTAVSAAGVSAGFSGAKNSQFYGHLTGPNFAVAGNLLATSETVPAIAEAFRKSEGRLSDRLLEALAAGERAGGDRRGKQSAAILVVRPGAYFNGKVVDLRVDDSPDPIAELRQIHDVFMTDFAAVPGYRAVRVGDKGAYVKKLNSWLVAVDSERKNDLKIADDEVTTATAAALRRFLNGAAGALAEGGGVHSETSAGAVLQLTPRESWRLQRVAAKKHP